MIDYLYNVNPVILAFLFSFFAFIVTTLGSSTVFFIKNIDKTALDIMMSLSAGIMISASFFSLINPSLDIAKSLNISAALHSSLGFLFGGLFLFLVDKLFDKISFKKRTIKRDILLIGSITIHNIPEGLAVGVAFGSIIDHASLTGAIMLAIGIAIQNFPEGSAISMPLKRDKVSTFKSFILGSLSALVEPISAVIGCILSMRVKNIMPFFLCFAAGAMIYVACSELIPEAMKNRNKSLISMFILIGFTIMMVLDISF